MISLGTGIALLIIGAILAFAVNFNLAGIDIHVIGYICMLGGLAAILLYFIQSGRRRTVVRERVVAPPAERVVRETPVRDRVVERDPRDPRV